MVKELILNEVISNTLELTLAVISIIVSTILIPRIKKDLIPWLEDKRIYSAVKKFVKAAEKLAETGAIEKVDKKNTVIELLEEQGIEVDDKVGAFIESAVKELDLVYQTVKDELLK